MNPDALTALTSTYDWAFLWPEIALVGLALVLILVDVLSPARIRVALAVNVAIFALLGIFIGLLVHLFTGGLVEAPVHGGAMQPYTLFGGLIGVDTFTQLMRMFFLLIAIPIGYFGMLYLSRHDLPRVEFLALICVATAAMMVLVMSRNFLMLFVALETVTVTFYVLVSYCRYSPFSLEAGLKYVILGGLSSAILLFGIVLLYAAAGAAAPNALDFSTLATFITENPDGILVRMGAVMVLAGLGFKIGAVPFQVWIPDVYQGAPTPVTAFLAVGSKAAGFTILAVLVGGPFEAIGDFLYPPLAAIACSTILFGNFTALAQRNIKRLIAMSGIAHAGYLLMGICAIARGVWWAEWAVALYLVTYMLGSFCVFAVMAHLSGVRDEVQTLDDYRPLARRDPFVAGVLTIGLASLAGVPPLAGFIGKLFVFIAAFEANLFTVLGIAAVGVAVSIYYYFGWIRAAFFPERIEDVPEAESARRLPLALEHKIALGALAAGTLVLGIAQGGWAG